MGRKPAKPRPAGLSPSIYARLRKDGSGAYDLYYFDPITKRQKSTKVAEFKPGKAEDPKVIKVANEEASKQLAALKKGKQLDKPANITVPEAWEKFLSRSTTRNPKRKKLKHSSQQDYRSQWNCYLEPAFGKLKVVELTEERIERFLADLDELVFEGTAEELREANALLRKPTADANSEIRRENRKLKYRHDKEAEAALAAKKKRPPAPTLRPLKRFPQPLLSEKRRDNIVITLRGLCSFCVEERWLEENPAAHLHWKGYVKRPFAIPTYDETVQLLKVIDPHYAPLVEFALYTGCRMGEIIAARRDWIDWEHRRFEVRGSFTHGKFNDTTKSGDTRVVPLPKRLMTMLEQRGVKDWPPNRILFASKTGNRLSLDTFRQRVWNPAVEAIGRPDLAPHCLRHTFITWTVRQAPKTGATTLAIARVSGHRQLSSVEWYVETWNEQLDAIARGFDESKEELELRRQGISDEQLLELKAPTEDLTVPPALKSKPQGEAKPKGKGIVVKRKATKPPSQS